jgi:transposase
MVYVDETGMDQFLTRTHARSAKGIPVLGAVSGKRYRRSSLVAALQGKEILAPMQYEGTMDSDLFCFWFETMLLPTLATGSVIIMDNASFHPKLRLLLLAESAGCSLLFLPAYSPDLNPIEKYWAWLKQQLRSILHLFPSFDSALTACL